MTALERTRQEGLVLALAGSQRECAALADEYAVLKRAYDTQALALTRANAALTELRASVGVLQQAVLDQGAKLTRLGVTSELSSKPPSHDAPHERERRHYPERARSQAKPGRVKGTPGVEVTFRTPDEVIVCEPDECRKCHSSLADSPQVNVERRQVHEVVTFTRTTEYQGVTRKCGECQTKTAAVFPSEARARNCFGSGVRGAALELSVNAHVPLRTCAGLVSSLLGVGLSHAVIGTWITQAAAHLRTKGFEAALVEALRNSPMVHADETPMSLNGKIVYVHAQANELCTYLFPGDRTREAIRSGGVLGGYEGTLVSDDYVGYKKLLGPEGTRQLCWAHLLRDLDWFAEAFSPSTKARASGHTHPHPLLGELATTVRGYIHAVHEGHTPEPSGFRVLLGRALTASAPVPGMPRGAQDDDLHTLLLRLHQRDSELWAFLGGTVPPTNNLAEQAVRPEKTRGKRSGAYRNETAMRDRLLVRSYQDTLRKHQRDLVAGLKALAAGEEVFLPEVPTG